MKMHGYKIKTLFQYGLKDLFKNPQTLILVILPLFFAILYKNMGLGEGTAMTFLLMLCAVLNIAMIPITLMGNMIAEEKEKNTLRTLMLSNVSSNEFLISKALICLVLLILTNTIIFFIVGAPTSTFLSYSILMLFVSVAVIFFGAIVGILSKNQMSTGVFATPIMLVFMLPIFMMNQNGILVNISKLLPTDAMIRLYGLLEKQTYTTEMIFPSIVIIVWIIIGGILFNMIFKKKGFDN